MCTHKTHLQLIHWLKLIKYSKHFKLSVAKAPTTVMLLIVTWISKNKETYLASNVGSSNYNKPGISG